MLDGRMRNKAYPKQAVWFCTAVIVVVAGIVSHGCIPGYEDNAAFLVKSLKNNGCAGCSPWEGEMPEGEPIPPDELEIETVAVPAGTFNMGRPYDDEGFEEELPVHQVYLNSYQIGKYPVTNREYAVVLNWAQAKGYLQDASGAIYSGGAVWAHGQPIADTYTTNDYSQIIYVDGKFDVISRPGYNKERFFMDDHPVVCVSWYGAVAFCNWLSEIKSLAPCYDLSGWTRCDPLSDGYRLPTEAEWERAAAWEPNAGDGEKHWRYGIRSDTIDITMANYLGSSMANPLGLASPPYTSPVGWYNGINPAQLDTEDVLTLDSMSPVGAYDMAGNVWEWCHDWYHNSYYAACPEANPPGPETGTARILRGGAWNFNYKINRAAIRLRNNPQYMLYVYGFRVCTSAAG